MPEKKSDRAANDADDSTEESSSGGRPIWTGSISFGLVNVPISLYSLEQRSDVHFRMLDGRDKSGIRYQRINESTGEEVPWGEIVKAYEYSEDNYVVLTPEDLKSIQLESVKTIDVKAFVQREEIDEIFYDKPYIVVPKKKAEKGYVLLRDVLAETDRVGIAKVAIRTREYLAALIPRGPAMVVMLLRFAHELRQIKGFKLPKDSPSTYNISEREHDLARQLVEAMTAEWDPTEYEDEYRSALLNYIEEKVAAGGLTPKAASEDEPLRESANVIDLAALLRESLSGKTEEEPKPREKRG